MADLEIIDAHTHTFASVDNGIRYQRGTGGADREIVRYGTIDELQGLMKEAGISRAIMLNFTPTRYLYEGRMAKTELPEDPAARQKIERDAQIVMAKRMIEHNEWQIEVSQQHPEFINFAGLDPVFMDEQMLIGEIEDKVSRGAKGVKIVLRALAIYADDPRLTPVYERISQLGVPITAQVGLHGEAGERGAYANPKFFEAALTQFPDLKVNCVHLGHGFEDEVADLCQRFPNAYTDVSSRLHTVDDPNSGIDRQWMVDFIRRCGADHVMFGTNYPGGDPVQYAKILRELSLTDSELELVASGNVKRFANLE